MSTTNYYTEEQVYQIANTIWLQLGAQRFSVATDSKPISYGEKDGKVFLQMSVGKNTHDINRFEVAYNEGQDLYEVRFMRQRDGRTEVVADYSGIYCDMLHTLFTQHTGLVLNFKVIA